MGDEGNEPLLNGEISINGEATSYVPIGYKIAIVVLSLVFAGTLVGLIIVAVQASKTPPVPPAVVCVDLE